MAAQYVEITLEEMEKFLKRAFRILRPKQSQQRGEVCYDLKLGAFVGIRVWTSIRPGSGTGAAVGADAIRVQFVSLKDQGPLEKGKAPIVKRTQGWRDNLKDRVEDLIEKYEEKEEWWENWAGTRTRSGDPEKVLRVQEQEEKRQEQEQAQAEKRERFVEEQKALGVYGEGEEDRDLQGRGAFEAFQKTYEYAKCQKLTGDITSPQMGFIRHLLHGLGHDDWFNSGAAEATGIDHIPNQSQLRSLTKAHGCMIIELLKRRAPRQASDTSLEEDIES